MNMNNAPVELHTNIGLVQKHANIDALLADKNRHGSWYAVRECKEGVELWHKGQGRRVGLLVFATE